MKKLSTLMIVMFAVIFSISSCAGPEGPAGYDGYDGESDVKSIVYTINRSDWQAVPEEWGMWQHIRNSRFVTPDVVDNGCVIFYMRSNNATGTWGALPYTANFYTENDVQFAHEFDVWHGDGHLEIIFRDTHPDKPEVPASDIVIKAMIISGTAYNMIERGEVDINDYDAVEKAFGAGSNFAR
ncbi:MAG: hypothetical protein PF588_01190 [Candidatus Kapabacteria bacterium]|jgi:hypothetical protein|nr:hypothetical protein [Candidatus Kapabacteria bacterium]